METIRKVKNIMSQSQNECVELKVRNFGPIRDGFREHNGFMCFPKVTMFCGPQGSGKSTVTKLISSLTWLEKAAYIIGWGEKGLELKGRSVVEQLLGWHGLKSYFKSDSEIEYHGPYISVVYNRDGGSVKPVVAGGTKYSKPKVMYVPAERNFLHILSKSAGVKLLPSPLVALQEEFQHAKDELSESVAIPVNGYRFRYHKETDMSVVVNASDEGQGSETPIEESSSGLQSLIPLLLVTNFLNSQIQDGQRNVRRVGSMSLMIDGNPFMEVPEGKGTVMYAQSDLPLEDRFYMTRSALKYAGLINIVEEPEQNLFPPTQRRVLRMLLAANNRFAANKLIVSTHSPYLVSELMAASASAGLRELNARRKDGIGDCSGRIEELYPADASVCADQVRIYETDHVGRIVGVERVGEVFSDENYLNRHLRLANRHFSEMMLIKSILAGDPPPPRRN